MIFETRPWIWAYLTPIGDTVLILYLDAKLSNPFYADFLVVLLTAIDGKEEVSDQA